MVLIPKVVPSQHSLKYITHTLIYIVKSNFPKALKCREMLTFLRAESFYNVATKAEEFGVLKSYGGKSLHEQSHGEAFLATLMHKLTGNGLVSY
jgi:predicted ATPase